jgi:hypothetical protein
VVRTSFGTVVEVLSEGLLYGSCVVVVVVLVVVAVVLVRVVLVVVDDDGTVVDNVPTTNMVRDNVPVNTNGARTVAG